MAKYVTFIRKVSAVLAAASACTVLAMAAAWTARQENPQQPPIIDEKTTLLFDGETWIHWHQRNGAASQWKPQPDGSVLVNGGDAISNEEFGDFQLHIEFRCPTTEGKEGQAKSNSGVYLHGRYEIQVLDSFGDPPANNMCGSLYLIASPLVNASRRAGQWQTYDIVFRAPRFDEQQKMTEQPRVTVIHNDVVIHNHVVVPNATPGGVDQTMPARGPLLLQDHGDPIQYRNIWIRKL